MYTITFIYIYIRVIIWIFKILYYYILYKTCNITKYLWFILGENGPNHKLECPILRRIEESFLPKFYTSQVVDISNGTVSLVPEYAAILPIRVLQLKEQNPYLWSRVDLLMDHIEDMDSTQKEKWKASKILY